MKLALLAIAALFAACAASPPDQPEVAPRPISVISRCDQAPQSAPFPPWSMAAVPGDASHLTVSRSEWDQHAEWAAAAQRWAGCVKPLVDTTSCGADPGVASWKLSWPAADPAHVVVEAQWLADHVAWFDARTSWDDCVSTLEYAQ